MFACPDYGNMRSIDHIFFPNDALILRAKRIKDRQTVTCKNAGFLNPRDNLSLLIFLATFLRACLKTLAP